jgi:predicted hydrocarbon binding protein
VAKQIHVKGIAIKARVAYIQARFGEEGLARVMEALSPEHRSYLRDDVIVSSWYPFALFEDIMACAERIFGKNDGALCREAGAASCRLGFETVYNKFATASDIPKAIANFTTILWKSYYDTGRLEVRSPSPGYVEVELCDFKVPHRTLCYALVGFFETALKIWGASHVLVAHPSCHEKGAKNCIFAVSWD